jgi:hypothetical protein
MLSAFKAWLKAKRHEGEIPRHPHHFLYSYPYLDGLLGGYFHQDFDHDGKTQLNQIIPDYKSSAHPEEIMGTKADIKRFIRYFGETDEVLREMYNTLFRPDVDPEGWIEHGKSLTTRQFLETIYDLL